MAKAAEARQRREEMARTRPAGADELWDREHLAPIDEEIARYETAARRMGDYHRTFMESVAPEVRESADAMVTVRGADGTQREERLSEHLYNFRSESDAAARRLSAAEESGDTAAADAARA